MSGATYILVHGTGDAAPSAPGADAKWWEPQSDFTRELLAADPGARAEAFIWSGDNDELKRRAAALALLKVLRKRKDERIILIGHSHGGSVIALALRMAAAKRLDLSNVVRWTTVGAPFIQMKRKPLPWDRYNVFGQAVLAFAVITFSLFVMGFTSAVGLFGDLYRIGGAGGCALCLFLLWLSQRGASALYAGSARCRFARFFTNRWTSATARRDEAIGGLIRLPTLRPTLFNNRFPAPLFRTIVSLAFIAVIAVNWLFLGPLAPGVVESPLNSPILTALIDFHTEFFGFLFNNVSIFVILAEFVDKYVPSIIGTALFPVIIIAIYLAALTALLRLSDLLVGATIGRLVAGALNNSARGTILAKAYGNTTVGEDAYAVRTSPFEDVPGAAPMPPAADAALLAYARAHAAESLAAMHDEIFLMDPDDPPRALDLEALAGTLSWRELVHTSYFKVPEARAHIISLAVAG
ncbi:MAG: hypothetical protein GC152_06045 [Alphaproteobacteria bacterium]|nr:hypothetical protein [Alphaproteobacteria bacterium]